MNPAAHRTLARYVIDVLQDWQADLRADGHTITFDTVADMLIAADALDASIAADTEGVDVRSHPRRPDVERETIRALADLTHTQTLAGRVH